MVNKEIALGFVFVTIASLMMLMTMYYLNVGLLWEMISFTMISSSLLYYVVYFVYYRMLRQKYIKRYFSNLELPMDEFILLDGMCQDIDSCKKLNAKMTLTSKRLIFQFDHRTNEVLMLDSIDHIQLKKFCRIVDSGLLIRSRDTVKNIKIDYASDWKEQIEATLNC